MAEFLEDPSVLTKDKLKNELAANNVPLPSGEHKKEVYVQLYLKNLTVLNNKKSPPIDAFSSDEELPAPVVSNKSRSGRKATKKTDKPRTEEVEVTDLTDEDLKQQLAKHGVDKLIHTAAVMKVLVVLVLAVFTAGCDANVVRQNRPKQQLDMVKDAFWDYVSKATTTAEDSLKQIRQSQLGKEVNTLISESTDAVNKLTDALRTQVAPLTKDLMVKFTQEAEQLKTRLEKDLTAMGTQLQPYAEEVVADLQKQVEQLKKDATPYANTMDPEALKTVLLQKSQELKGQLDKSVSRLQTQMVPYAEEIKEKMEQSLEEFQRSMTPLAQSFETQLTQKTQEIQQSLAPYGEELREKLNADARNLKRQLMALWKSFTKMTQ